MQKKKLRIKSLCTKKQPGNGNSLIGVASALKVMIMGEADHLIHTFVMKYIDITNTNTNINPKKHLEKLDSLLYSNL